MVSKYWGGGGVRIQRLRNRKRPRAWEFPGLGDRLEAHKCSRECSQGCTPKSGCSRVLVKVLFLSFSFLDTSVGTLTSTLQSTPGSGQPLWNLKCPHFGSQSVPPVLVLNHRPVCFSIWLPVQWPHLFQGRCCLLYLVPVKRRPASRIFRILRFGVLRSKMRKIRIYIRMTEQGCWV